MEKSKTPKEQKAACRIARKALRMEIVKFFERDDCESEDVNTFRHAKRMVQVCHELGITAQALHVYLVACAVQENMMRPGFPHAEADAEMLDFFFAGAAKEALRILKHKPHTPHRTPRKEYNMPRRLMLIEEMNSACRSLRKVLRQQMRSHSEAENDPMSDYVGYHPRISYAPYVRTIERACCQLGLKMDDFYTYMRNCVDEEITFLTPWQVCPNAYEELSWLHHAVEQSLLDGLEGRKR